MCFTDLDYCSVHNTRVVRIRKPRRCYECRREMPVGESARYVFCVTNGQSFSCYVCGKCETLRRKIHDHEISEGCKEHESWCPYGEVLDYVAQVRDVDWSVTDAEIENALCKTVRS